MRKYTVLAVDDNPKILKMIVRSLGTSRYRLVTALDAEMALDILEQLKVDLIISDYLMPEISGLDFLKTVKEKHQPIPYILQTGFADYPLAKSAINEVGIAALLEKPWTPSQLADAVNNALKSHDISTKKETLRDLMKNESSSEQEITTQTGDHTNTGKPEKHTMQNAESTHHHNTDVDVWS